MIQIKKLTNNIPVIFEPIDRLRLVSFGIYVKMGSAGENSKNNGISHVIEHMLFKGTEEKSARELADIMTDLGGNINAYTAKEHTSYYGTVLNQDFYKAMKLMGEMFKYPAFNQKEFSREKHVIIDEIDMYDDSAEDLCHELLQKKIWKDSPYGYIISGTKTNVRGFKRDDVKKIWSEKYTAENIVISVAGGVDEKELYKVLEECFGDIQNGEGCTEYAAPEYNRVFLNKYKDTEQIHINMAFDCITGAAKERYAMGIINAALGGNLNSRLFQKVREELGLTYSIYSYSSAFEKAGLFHIYATACPEETGVCIDAIKNVVEAMRESSLSEQELETIKRQMTTELILSGETAGQKMSANAKSYMSLGRIETVDETIEKMKAVTPDEINECLQKYLDVKNASLSLVGDILNADCKKIKKDWE